MEISGIAVEIIEIASGVPVIDKNIFGIGDCLLQNLPSIICSKVLSPQPGDFVLDMCAAPGNKTSHMAEIMNNKVIRRVFIFNRLHCMYALMNFTGSYCCN